MTQREKPYRYVNIRKELIDDIEVWIKKHPEAGYVSIADLASESIRIRIQELNEKYPSKP